MSFRAQVRWALTRGVGVAVAGALLAFPTVVLETRGMWLAGPFGILTMVLIAGGAMLALVGGVMRPAQRLVFRHGLPTGRLRGLVLDRPALRWWYGLDESGQARDD